MTVYASLPEVVYLQGCFAGKIRDNFNYQEMNRG